MQPMFDPGFSTVGMVEVFSAEATVAAILEFEGALALALADAGIAPADEAAIVAEACSEPLPDAQQLLATTWEAGTPLIAIREAILARVGAQTAGRWVHLGATSQDALDTGRMLQSRTALHLLESSTTTITGQLHSLVVQYRDQPQMARTFLQDARPTTFGARAAMWLAPTLEYLADMRRVREGLRVQLGGPSGYPTEYGQAARAVTEALAGRLGLVAPSVSWHTDRSPIWRLAHTVESGTQSLRKIATDISLMAQTSVAEVKVRPGGSSSMPEKRNPIDAIRTVAAAAANHGFASMLTGAPVNELDRGLGGWHTEWLALPMLFHTAAAAAEGIEACLESLEIDAEAMASGVDEQGAEALTRADVGIIDGVIARFDEVVGRV